MPLHNRIWWGAPRKFSTSLAERKISWLELFYDLVYVIVISRTTQRLVQHPTLTGLGEYIYLFALIFWGWLNGSQYYDLHGSPGIRTRFMTLWQMIAVAALAVSLDSPADKFLFRTTVSIAFLQLFITYLWWSVGIYDKEHRRLNLPYSVCYLAALGCIVGSLFLPAGFTTLLFWAALVFNFLPPFLTAVRLRDSVGSLTLSLSMTERLGLMVIIVFGEAILGVINGMSNIGDIMAGQWVCFGLGILILFCMWWVFFGLIADRECRQGLAVGITMSSLYIPAIAALGMTGASFPLLMKGGDAWWPRALYGSGIIVFLLCIILISVFLRYPQRYLRYKRPMQLIIFAAAVAIGIITVTMIATTALTYLVACFVVLAILVAASTGLWAKIEAPFIGDDAV